MAELVAEAFLSAAFEKLFELLASSEFRSFFREKKSIDDQLKLLNEKLKNASLLLNDAEGRQITDEKAKEWLDDLQDVIFRADNLVEEIKAEARSEQERESASTRSMLKKMLALVTPFTEFDKFVQGEMGNILKDLGFLLERASTLHLKHIDGAPNTRSFRSLPAPLRDERYVRGRDADKKEILRLVLSGEVWGKKLGVIPIVGMGGLGKTTLAQFVYNHNRVNDHEFQLKAWVTVSTEFHICKIARTIMEQISPGTSGIKEPAELQRRLKEALRGKKFLLVLDDVWDESYDNWDLLRCTFPSEESGSRIIVTTRSKKVAANVKTGELIYELSQMSEPDCWNIFVDHALNGDADADPRLQDIGKKIVEKCKGVPLAVKSIGGLLRSEKSPEKWESILRSHVWESRSNELILPSLWLSYCYLPSRLKQCFAYCSIFPKDYPLEKRKIILFWMAEGLLQFDKKEERLEDVGQEYLDDLISRSLFQSSSRGESWFVMHDLVHDLAMFVSREFCFRFDHDIDLKHLSKKTRHISYSLSGDQKLWKGLFQANHLRTFTEKNRYGFRDTELVKEVLGGGRYLRVLALSPDIEIRMLMDSFSNLKHLRYLDISGSGIEELPCSICSLYNLQTLVLSRCIGLTWLPTAMGRLTNLRHLVTTKTPLKEMPPHMGNLKELQTLTSFVLGEHGSGSSIKELGALQNLRGKLSISGLQNVESVEEVQEANLRDKDKLRELTLEWEGDVTNTIREKEVLDALKPHPNLLKLEIRRYAASSFPDWVGDSLLLKLVSVRLTGNGDFCHALPPLGQLPSLQELVIQSFHGVEKIGPEFYTADNSSISPFQSLEILNFSYMERWKEWSFIGQDGKEDGCFPRLKKLSFRSCPNLAGSLPKCDAIESLKIWDSYKIMESLPLDNFPKLKELVLQGCESLKELIVDSPDVIETLHITGCNKLEFPGSHHYVHVKELEIDCGCDSVKTLPLDYFPRLENLHLKGCQNLESLTFTEETCIALQSLSIADCKNLRSLPELMHRLLPSLSEMSMWSCPEIEASPKGGLPSTLNTLRIWECCKLVAQSRHWNLQGLTSLRELDIGGCEDIMLDSFPEGLLPSSLTSFRLSKLPHLKSLNGSAFQNVTSLEVLVLWNCKELQLLPREVLLPTPLRSLLILHCPFLERRYQKGKGEDWHQISHIPDIQISGDTTMQVEAAWTSFHFRPVRPCAALEGDFKRD